MSRARQLLFGPTAPRTWSAFQRREHAIGVATYLGAAGIHACLLVGFAVVGAWPLVWFNIGSILVWLVVGVLHRLHRTRWALALGMTEIVAHAVFATRVIGWQSGLQLALPIVSGLYFGFSRSSRAILPLVGMTIWMAAFPWLFRGVPWVQLSPQAESLFAFASGIWGFLIVALVVSSLARNADRAEKALEAEHERSERLVHNMLPAEIATRLKGGEANIAERVDEASVLFADLVGFTALSAQVKPGELVLMLSDLFSRFDTLVQKHGLEKIKTIGDAYMVASGVPRARADHAPALATFALELVQMIEALPVAHGARLRMRIGISSGPIVAGVIGLTKPAYDMWGDTVNTAARMESHGEPGRIHITKEVRDRLGAAFQVESRGTIDVKGKGPMETYFLDGKRGQATFPGPPEK
jgi:adenylate cyclase